MTTDDDISTLPVDSESRKVNEALSQGFEELKIQDNFVPGLDNNLDYTPPNGDVQSMVKTITSAIRRVAHSLATDDFQVERFSSSMVQHYRDISEMLRERSLSGFVQDNNSTQEKDVPFLKMIVSWALWSWTFYPSTPSVLPVPDSVKTRSEVLLDAYKGIALPERRLLRILNERALLISL
jgi:hypothetical protein